MKEFKTPEVEIVTFLAEDVIATSNPGASCTPVTGGQECENMQVTCKNMCVTEHYPAN